MDQTGFNASLDDVDFEEVYRGAAPLDGGAGSQSRPPWDIGEPQPVLVEVEAEGLIRGSVLDVGCGLGDNAIFLAERGHRVTGVDFSPTAIERARGRAAERGADVEFAVADATRLDGFDGRFDTVVDSALFHCFDPGQRAAYLDALRRVCAPGGTVHMFCCVDAGEVRIPVPHPVTEAALRDGFATGWRLAELSVAQYTTAFGRDAFEALLAAQGADADCFGELEFDHEGRVRFPVWKLRAIRE